VESTAWADTTPRRRRWQTSGKRPSAPGTIDGDITSRIARLAALLAPEVADATERPRWDAAARCARQLAP
jgi:hypothetical protein